MSLFSRIFTGVLQFLQEFYNLRELEDHLFFKLDIICLKQIRKFEMFLKSYL